MLHHIKKNWMPLLAVALLTAYMFSTQMAVFAIEGYQRYISPHKGYHCAHAAHHGGSSCSQFAKEAIELNGVVKGTSMLLDRLRDCKTAYQIIRSTPSPQIRGGCLKGAGKVAPDIACFFLSD